MRYEIERRFLVIGDSWRPAVVARIRMRQAYLNFDGTSSVRVRIEDSQRAVLTVKARGPALRRFEIAYPLPVADAEILLQHRRGSVVEKTRHIVPCAGSTWEVDVFAGENAGLVIAGIELRPGAACVRRVGRRRVRQPPARARAGMTAAAVAISAAPVPSP